MNVVVISDTHTSEPEVPNGDLLIHCGDFTFRGAANESKRALDWFNSLPHKYKVFIAGNHELGWQSPTNRKYILAHAPNCIYLHCSGVEIEGLKLWGSPYQPEFNGWAFQLGRGKYGLETHWMQVPEDLDILITHGPPAGIGDCNDRDERFGDEDLLNRVLQVRPQYHLFGHAHHGYGIYSKEDITFINAAIMDEEYQPVHKPICFTINLRRRKHNLSEGKPVQ